MVRIADEIVIDLLEKAGDVSFEQTRRHIVYDTIKGVPIPYLDIELLLMTKQGIRPKDIEDKRFLEKVLEDLKKK